jgi:DNA-directed RNA polymerase specialized sigma24 family protein
MAQEGSTPSATTSAANRRRRNVPSLDTKQALLLALDRLAEWDERQARAVILRYFRRLTVPEVAVAVGVAPATVERDWRLARAWLRGIVRSIADQ